MTRLGVPRVGVSVGGLSSAGGVLEEKIVGLVDTDVCDGVVKLEQAELVQTKKWRTKGGKVSKEEMSIAVGHQIRSRAGMQHELLFGKKGENVNTKLSVGEGKSVGDKNSMKSTIVDAVASEQLLLPGSVALSTVQPVEVLPGSVVSNAVQPKGDKPGSVIITNAVQPAGVLPGSVITENAVQSAGVLPGSVIAKNAVQSRKVLPGSAITDHMTQPIFPSGDPVSGSHEDRLHWKSLTKQRRQQLQCQQAEQSYWTEHDGSFEASVRFSHPEKHEFRGGMCPSNLALQHPAAPLLQQYATEGCPVDISRLWTRAEIEAAVEYGNHPMEESASTQFYEEALIKEKQGLVELFDWEVLKALPDDEFPMAMKLSPLSAVPHKSWNWRAILDLSWALKTTDDGGTSWHQ